MCWRPFRGWTGDRCVLVWRLALRWIRGSILGGVIRGTQMKCSGQARSLTAAMCVCLFSFTSRPLYLSLTILDLIARCGAKVRIHSYFYDCNILQQLEHDFWTVTGTRCSRRCRNRHRPPLYAGGAKPVFADFDFYK